jgi:hypothetical protein
MARILSSSFVTDRDHLYLPQLFLNAVFPGHLKISNFGYKTYSILKVEINWQVISECD